MTVNAVTAPVFGLPGSPGPGTSSPGASLAKCAVDGLSRRALVHGSGENEDRVAGLVIAPPARLNVVERDGPDVLGQAPFASSSRRRPDQLAGAVHGPQGGEPAEHVGDLVEQARLLAIEVGGRHAEVAHPGRGLGQLLLKISLGEDGGEHRVAVARLRVAPGLVAAEEGIRRARGLGAGGRGDGDVLDQVGEP